MANDFSPNMRNGNKLLALLSASEFKRLAPHMELVMLEPGQLLFQRGKTEFVYFPLSGIVTKLVIMLDGSKVNAGIIGNEGMLPLCIQLGLRATPFEGVVQNAGKALRMSASAFVANVQSGGPLYKILLRFAAAFMAQVSLSAACKRLHPLRAQYSRLLLMSVDRLGTPEFILTQATAAESLGVRRMSVAEVAHQLQDEGIIQYSRGKVLILDRARLKKISCECYGRIREVYESFSLNDPS